MLRLTDLQRKNLYDRFMIENYGLKYLYHSPTTYFNDLSFKIIPSQPCWIDDKHDKEYRKCLGPYFIDNLDAKFDILSSLICHEVIIKFSNTDNFHIFVKQIKNHFGKFIKVEYLDFFSIKIELIDKETTILEFNFVNANYSPNIFIIGKTEIYKTMKYCTGKNIKTENHKFSTMFKQCIRIPFKKRKCKYHYQQNKIKRPFN